MWKKGLSVATGLILIGIGGAALFHFTTHKPLESYERKWTFDAQKVRRLQIENSDQGMNVQFVPSEDGTNSVTFSGKAAAKVIERLKQTDVADGALTLNLKESGWNFLDFNFGNNKQNVTVALTDKTLLDSLVVSCDSGSATVTDAAARSAEVSSDSGSLHIENFSGEQLKLHADSGSVHVDGVKADLTVSVDSGSVKVDHLRGKSNISVDSGSVRLSKDDTADTDIKADSGSVVVEVPASFAGFYDLKADSGSIHAPESKRQTTDYVKVRTDSGSIRVEQPQ